MGSDFDQLWPADDYSDVSLSDRTDAIEQILETIFTIEDVIIIWSDTNCDGQNLTFNGFGKDSKEFELPIKNPQWIWPQKMLTKAESELPDGTALTLNMNYNAINEPSGMTAQIDHSIHEIKKLQSLSEIPPEYATIQEITDQLSTSLEACNDIRHSQAG